MNTLPDTFIGRASQKNWTFTKVKREGRVAIYSKTTPDISTTYYETVVINVHNGYKLGGVQFPPGETYPGDGMFGISGWCYNELEKAEQKFTQLLEYHATKNKN